MLGALAALAMVALAATQVAAGEFQKFYATGKGGTTLDVSFSLALVGAGHLVGLSVGIAGLLGVILGWGVAVPVLTAAMPDPSAALGAHVMAIWSHQVRFIGAGRHRGRGDLDAGQAGAGPSRSASSARWRRRAARPWRTGASAISAPAGSAG